MPTSASTADAHRTKRAYQPSITTFFSRRDPSSLSPTDRDSSNVPLPASIQASLLNVGMRVRKAVPEGYKTHKTKHISSFSAYTHPSSQPLHHTHDKENIDMANAASTSGSHRSGELQPFCGLLKVGGHGIQVQEPASYSWSARPTDALGAAYFALGDDAALFASSQESNASAVSTDSMPARRPLMQRGDSNGSGAGGAGKRAYDDFSDGEEEERGSEFVMPPSSLDGWVAMGFGAGRAIARPRGRRGRTSPQRFAVVSVGSSGEADDFGEADFLKPMEGEVEMGGV